MRLRIVDPRSIDSPDVLTALERQQLRIAGRMYDGEDRAPELRFAHLSESGGDDDGCFFLATSKVYEEDRHLFDLWQLDPDAAALFAAGTTKVAAGRVQSTWMTPDLMAPFVYAVALDEAMKAADIW